MMKFWILERRRNVGYDEYDAKVVMAETEEEARRVANKNTGDEGMLWDAPDEVACTELLPQGTACEILGRFNAG